MYSGGQTEDVSNDPAPDTPDGPHRLNVDYQSIATTLKVGLQVLLDDGLIALQVTRVENKSDGIMVARGGWKFLSVRCLLLRK
jgi:pyruvate kinase